MVIRDIVWCPGIGGFLLVGVCVSEAGQFLGVLCRHRPLAYGEDGRRLEVVRRYCTHGVCGRTWRDASAQLSLGR